MWMASGTRVQGIEVSATADLEGRSPAAGLSPEAPLVTATRPGFRLRADRAPLRVLAHGEQATECVA